MARSIVSRHHSRTREFAPFRCLSFFCPGNAIEFFFGSICVKSFQCVWWSIFFHALILVQILEGIVYIIARIIVPTFPLSIAFLFSFSNAHMHTLIYNKYLTLLHAFIRSIHMQFRFRNFACFFHWLGCASSIASSFIAANECDSQLWANLLNIDQILMHLHSQFYLRWCEFRNYTFLMSD